MIKIYLTEVEAINDNTRSRVFVISMEEVSVYTIRMDTMTHKEDLEALLDSIRIGIEMLEDRT